MIRMMNWKFIRLELGRTTEFPAGSVSRAYLLRLPLDDEDLIDTGAFELDPQRATVRRHWATEPDQRGQVVRSGDEWQMRCDGGTVSVEFDGRPIRLGEQVCVGSSDGRTLPFRVSSIR